MSGLTRGHRTLHLSTLLAHVSSSGTLPARRVFSSSLSPPSMNSATVTRLTLLVGVVVSTVAPAYAWPVPIHSFLHLRTDALDVKVLSRRDDPPAADSSSPSSLTIAVGVAVPVVLLAILGIVFFVIRRRRRDKEKVAAITPISLVAPTALQKLKNDTGTPTSAWFESTENLYPTAEKLKRPPTATVSESPTSSKFKWGRGSGPVGVRTSDSSARDRAFLADALDPTEDNSSPRTVKLGAGNMVAKHLLPLPQDRPAPPTSVSEMSSSSIGVVETAKSIKVKKADAKRMTVFSPIPEGQGSGRNTPHLSLDSNAMSDVFARHPYQQPPTGHRR